MITETRASYGGVGTRADAAAVRRVRRRGLGRVRSGGAGGQLLGRGDRGPCRQPQRRVGEGPCHLDDPLNARHWLARLARRRELCAGFWSHIGRVQIPSRSLGCPPVTSCRRCFTGPESPPILPWSTLIVHGARDRIIPVHSSRIVHQQIAGSDFVVLPGGRRTKVAFAKLDPQAREIYHRRSASDC